MGLTAVLKKKTRFISIDVDFSCPDGQTLALIGPSGSGKTTIVRMLAGLERPDEGRIVYRDRVFFDSARGVNLSPQKRKLGYVFQDYSLFPHLTLYGNAAFAAQNRKDVDSLMGFFGLTALRNRKPKLGLGRREAALRRMPGPGPKPATAAPRRALFGARCGHAAAPSQRAEKNNGNEDIPRGLRHP